MLEKILQQILTNVTNMSGKMDNMKKNHDVWFNKLEDSISKMS